VSTLPTRDSVLEEKFPKLRNGGYSIRSPREPGYNCVAFAVGNPTRYWQWMKYPTKGYYWPPGIEGDDTVDAWAKVFEIHGYKRCEDGNVEINTDKIAVYADADGTPTHVARFDSAVGKWVSKLGRRGYDIQHDSHELLEGHDEDEYGRVAVFLKRKGIK
jgi:hypothetical protein